MKKGFQKSVIEIFKNTCTNEIEKTDIGRMNLKHKSGESLY